MKNKLECPPSVSGREIMGLAVIMIIALLLRLQHFSTLLPWFHYLDETRTTGVSLFLLRNGTMDTSFTFYPALAFYVHAMGFFLWTVFSHLGEFISQGGEAIAMVIQDMSAESRQAILLSRGISLVFAMGSVLFVHLLARQYLGWRWALACTLLFALNSMHISISTLAKVDAVNIFWICAAYYTAVKYWRGQRRLSWLVAASVFTGLTVVTKYNYQLCLFVGLLAFLNALEDKGSFYRVLSDTLIFPLAWIKGLARGRRPSVNRAEGHIWIFLLVVFAAAFIGSPYSFIHARETLVSLGWIYKHGEIISTYHSDPHVWWLDRFYYLITIVLPFIFGLALFGIIVGSFINHARKYALADPFIMLNFIWFIYFLGSQSGGSIGGSFPYYLFLNIVPLGILIAVDGIRDLCMSKRRLLRAAGILLFLVILATSVLRTNSYWSMFYEGYNKLGAWSEEHAGDDDNMLLLSVFKPRKALGDMKKLSVWPHEVTRPEEVECDIIEIKEDTVYINQAFPGAGAGLCRTAPYRPELLIIDGWLMAGFRKVYRDTWVAPYWDTFIREQRGYELVLRIRPDYFNRSYYAGLDPEHDVEILVLKKRNTPQSRERRK